MTETLDRQQEVVDATVVEEHGTELAAVEAAPPSLFGTTNPVEVVQRASEVAGALKDILVSRQMVQNIKGKEYVKIEGWQTLGSMLGVVPVIVWTRELEGGWEARAEARMADGRVVGAADAMCVTAEGGNWGPRSTSNARRAMAQTRAMSRALRGPLGFVVTLAGYQATAAEEMPTGPPAPVAGVDEPFVRDARWIEAGRSERIAKSISAAIKSGIFDAKALRLECQARGLPLANGQLTPRAVKTLCSQLTPEQAEGIEGWLASIDGEVTA